MKIGMWSGIKICKKKIVDIFFHSEMRHAGTCERTRAHGPDLYVNTRSRNALARPHAQISIYSVNEVTVFTLPVC